MNRLIIPVFIPHQGCPNACVFCNQKQISGASSLPTKADLDSTVREHLNSTDRHYAEELAFFGGSFTAIPEEDMIRYLQWARPYLEAGQVGSIRVSTRPDAIDDRILGILEEYGVRTIELGAQSMDDTVLALSKRGHTAEDTGRASELIKKRGFILGLQTMIGLPGSTAEKEIATALGVATLNPAMVRIYPVLVLRGTELCDMYEKGIYGPFDDDTVLRLLAEVMGIYNEAGIDIIRVGLQSAERMTEEDDVAAGTTLPAMKQRAQSLEVRQRVAELFDRIGAANRSDRKIYIYCDSRDITAVVGRNKENVDYIKAVSGTAWLKITAKIPEKEITLPDGRTSERYDIMIKSLGRAIVLEVC